MACCPRSFLERADSNPPIPDEFFNITLYVLIVITFFSGVRYFSAFFQKGNYLSAELYTTSFPLFFPSYQSWVPELFCNLYPQAWIPSGLTVLSETGDALNSIFPLYLDFFSFDFAEKEGLRLVWKRPFIKRDPREPKNDFPTPSLTLVCWSRWPE